ncbi:MAG TPA: hypothetical protein DIW77_09085 [Chromatiaceae bacterium]|nr:MAG: hypothetical protein N838_07525 [Thiohalocapsa sp. PB-PSB1]HCS90192.1 hypothetical protein [Chromatiaceae bacterium]
MGVDQDQRHAIVGFDPDVDPDPGAYLQDLVLWESIANASTLVQLAAVCRNKAASLQSASRSNANVTKA